MERSIPRFLENKDDLIVLRNTLFFFIDHEIKGLLIWENEEGKQPNSIPLNISKNNLAVNCIQNSYN